VSRYCAQKPRAPLIGSNGCPVTSPIADTWVLCRLNGCRTKKPTFVPPDDGAGLPIPIVESF